MAEAGETTDVVADPSAAPAAGEDAHQPDSSTGVTAVPDGSAASSAAGEQDPRKAELNAVLKALDRPAPEGESPAPETAEGKDKAPPDAGVVDVKADDALLDNDKVDPRLAAETQTRIKGLLRVGKRLQGEIEPLKTQMAQLEPKAKHFDSIVSFATESGWTQEYFQDLLHMGRLMSKDPIAFYEAFRPQWSKIEEMVGAKLPADLQKQVTDGVLSAPAAKEMALLRTKSALSEGSLKAVNERNARERQAAENDRQQQAVEAAINASGASASGWERQWKGSDPDYAKKQPFVSALISQKLMPLLVDGKIPSSAEVLALCNASKKEVEENLRSILPQRTQIRTPNSGTTVDSKGAPATDLAVARQALEGMGAR